MHQCIRCPQGLEYHTAQQGPPPVGAAEWSPSPVIIILGHNCIKNAQQSGTISGLWSFHARVHLQQRQLWHMECIQFADDTTLHVSHSNKHYLKFCIESDMNVLFDWLNANKLMLNLNKSVFMLFQPSSQKNVDFHLELNGVTIPCVKSTKFLGVWLDTLILVRTYELTYFETQEQNVLIV